LFVVVLLAACDREPASRWVEQQPPVPQTPPQDPEPEPMRPPAPLPERPCPPGAQAFDIRARVVIADSIGVFHEDMPLRWIAQDGHFHELAADPLHPTDLGPSSAFKSTVWDDRYWYRARCYDDCEELTDMGVPLAIERVDRRTDKRVRLTQAEHGIHAIAPLGDSVYWGIYGHQIDGGVWRVLKQGGRQEPLLTSQKIERIHTYDDGLLVEAIAMVGWIPRIGEPSTVLGGIAEVGAATHDGDDFYVAERGDPYWQSKDSGYIHRIHAGKDTKLAGPVRWPSAVAAYGANVYFMLSETGDIWSVPKAGGTAKVALAGPRIEPCDNSLGLWADARGLYWLRGHRLFGAPGQRLYFMPWSALQPR
jgi:hypothetical protein